MVEVKLRDEDYSDLKDVRISFDDYQEVITEEGSIGFFVCLWIYLSGSTRPSSVILHQASLEREDEHPFLALSEENKLTLFPLMICNKEAPSTNSFPWIDMIHTSAKTECPLEKWVHVGCEVTTNHMRLHVDGTLVGEMPLSSVTNDNQSENILKKIIVMGNDGNDGKLQGYVYYVRVLPISASIKVQSVKNPPVKLSVDESCVPDGVEEGGDGVWSIVGGKASCRRNFPINVTLLDALGRSVYKEMEIVASLVYADNGTLVEKTGDDAEAPLLLSCDGLEFSSSEKPVTLLRGRANFKLKISQLSSKSDNRLFRVCFHTPHPPRYPFLEAYSHPIRCISRIRTIRTIGFGKRPISMMPPSDGSHSPGPTDGLIHDANGEISSRGEFKCNTSLKRLKDETAFMTISELKANNHSDSESTDARNRESRAGTQNTNPGSDTTIFRYCLEGTHERSILLKEMITYASVQEMERFSDQICLYAGCSHHRHQILISRQLVQEGSDTWNLISRENHAVLWADAAPKINGRFMSISNANRVLSAKDLEVLRAIAGCGDDLRRESFNRMWYWLYPVAVALSKKRLSTMWESKSPKWIEGLITKEEAESSLRGPRGLQKPGTFVLRFPISRRWPHPDAGGLVVTYVGADKALHHKLLSLDHISDDDEGRDPWKLQALLMEEPELTLLGRVRRDED